MEALGFKVNVDKSVMSPCQEIVFLGTCINSNTMTVSLTDKRKETIYSECVKLLHSNRASIRQVARVIGLIVAAFPAVEFGPLFYRNLENAKTKALQAAAYDFDANMPITEVMKEDLRWWVSGVHTESRMIFRDRFTVSLETDASLQGWGASCNGVNTGGRWNVDELIEGGKL